MDAYSYPSSTYPSSFEADSEGHNGKPTARWSSLIGIIISITGNIVISFALNIQKYAHIRLAREKSLRLQERNKNKKRRRRKKQDIAKNGSTKVGGNGLLKPDSNNNGSLGHQEVEDLESSFVSTSSWDSREDYDDEDNRGRSPVQNDEAYLLDSPDRSLSNTGIGPAPPYLRSYWWWFGIVIMAIGECGNFLAYGFAPASIVSPLGVVALISNCLIAPLMLKEPFRRRDFFGVVIAITGVAIVVSSSNPKEEKLTPGQIWWEISQTPFEVYFGVTCGLIALMLYLSNIYGSKIILIDLGLVGLFGGFTVLATKGVSSLLSTTLYKVVTYPVFYLLVFVLVGTAILQIKYLNRALQRFDSTQVIPTQFVLFNICTVTGSAILYRDFEQADASRLTRFFTGCLLNFLGVYLISSKRKRSQYDDDDRSTISDVENEDARYADHVAETPAMLVTSAEDGNRPIRPEIDAKVSNSSTYVPTVDPISERSHSSSPSPSSRPVLPKRKTTSNGGSRTGTPTENSPLLPPLRTSFQSYQTENARSRSPSPNHLRPNHDSIVFSSTPNTTSSSARHSLSMLTPGPLFVGYQLQAVVADSLKRGLDHMADDDGGNNAHSYSSSHSYTRERERKVRKVRSIGGIGGWLRSGSKETPRKRAGTLESIRTSRSTGRGNESDLESASTADVGRRGTLAMAEGVARREAERGRRSRQESYGEQAAFKAPDVQRMEMEGADAPLPNPKDTNTGADE